MELWALLPILPARSKTGHCRCTDHSLSLCMKLDLVCPRKLPSTLLLPDLRAKWDQNISARRGGFHLEFELGSELIAKPVCPVASTYGRRLAPNCRTESKDSWKMQTARV